MVLTPLPALSNFGSSHDRAQQPPALHDRGNARGGNAGNQAGNLADDATRDAPVYFWADQMVYREKESVISAHGHVEIKRGGDRLQADEIVYDQKSGRIVVQGNVRFTRATGDVIETSRFELNDDLRDGVAHEIRLITADNARAWAEKIVRRDGREMILTRGAYTPCKLCEEHPEKAPLWTLKAEEIRLDEVDQRVYFHDSSLEVLGVPVAYMPWMSFPDPRVKKDSGFLVPSFGHHGDLGFYVGVPYFFNLAPHRDLTIDPVLYFQTGQLLLQAEYREAMENGYFTIGASTTYISTSNEVGGLSHDGEELRGHVEATGRFNLDDNWRWGFDALRSSDDTYLRRYDLDDSKTLTSRAYVEGFFDRDYALVEGYSFQNQRQDRDATLTPDLVSHMVYDHVGRPNQLGAYWTADAGVLGIMRSDNRDSARLHGNLGWHLPIVSPHGDLVDLRTGVSLAAYHSEDYINPLTGLPSGESDIQTFPYISASWRYPMVRDHGSYTEHLEPVVQALLSPNPSQSGDIPNEDSRGIWFSDSNLFDANRYPGLDRFDGGQRLDYGLRWAFQDQRDGASLEFFLGQSYRLHESALLDRSTGLEDRSSDIVGHAKISPNEYVDVYYRFRLANEDLGLRQSVLRLSTGGPDLRLTVDHTYVNQEANTIGPDQRNEIYTKLETRLTQFWRASVFERHQFSNPDGNMAAGASLSYQDECLRVDLELERNRYRDRDLAPETTVLLRFSLKNLGNFAQANGLH